MLILDTHTLVWIGAGGAKLGRNAAAAIRDAGQSLFVSAVTAWEYVDLRARDRLPEAAEFAILQRKLHFTVLDLPAEVWRLLALMPDIHRDPVDRMLVAHAITADLTLITVDSDMRRYPVRTIW